MSNGGEQNSFPVKTKLNAMMSPLPFLSVKPTCSIPICHENCRLDEGYFVDSHDPLCRHQYSSRNDKTHFYWLLASFCQMTRGWSMLVCYPSTFHHVADFCFLFSCFSSKTALLMNLFQTILNHCHRYSWISLHFLD